MFRNVIANLISPIIAITGFRFSKDYRHGITKKHRIVYTFINTIQANRLADNLISYFTKA